MNFKNISIILLLGSTLCLSLVANANELTLQEAKQEIARLEDENRSLKEKLKAFEKKVEEFKEKIEQYEIMDVNKTEIAR